MPFRHIGLTTTFFCFPPFICAAIITGWQSWYALSACFPCIEALSQLRFIANLQASQFGGLNMPKILGCGFEPFLDDAKHNSFGIQSDVWKTSRKCRTKVALLETQRIFAYFRIFHSICNRHEQNFEISGKICLDARIAVSSDAYTDVRILSISGY